MKIHISHKLVEFYDLLTPIILYIIFLKIYMPIFIVILSFKMTKKYDRLLLIYQKC